MFLVFDSGIDDLDRILVLPLEKGLDDLESSKNWAFDGTFKVSPSLWGQLVTLHIIIGRLCVPRLFALLPDKKEASYHRLLPAVRNLRPNCQPVTCLMDFEKVLHNSFVSLFPYSEVVGRVFHFGQSCWRKICALGESMRDTTDEIFQLKIECFCVLAFLPIEDVVNVFEDLSDDEDIPSEFITYFEITYSESSLVTSRLSTSL